MNPAPGKQAARSAKETAGLLSSFRKVRILHYAAAKPVASSTILERLRSHGCSIAPAALNRLLLRMNHNGWLKCNHTPAGGPRNHRTYSLTPKGRRALSNAKNSLKQLHANWFTKQQHKTDEL